MFNGTCRATVCRGGLEGYFVMKVRVERDRGMGSVVNLTLHSDLCHPFSTPLSLSVSRC